MNLLLSIAHQALYGTVFQHDNARPHAARETTQLLTNNNVQNSPLASMSQVLNPNKHTWNKLERRVRGRMDAPANVRDSFQALKQEWVAIPGQVIT